MTTGPQHHPNLRLTAVDPDPLPEGFEGELIDLDRALGEHFRSQPAPAGLADRVHRASVRDLPARRLDPALVETSAPRLRFALRRQWWGRVAMAAALGVAFVLAARTMQPAVSTDRPTFMVADAGYSYLTEGPLDDTRAEVAQILDTWSMRHEDVTGELEALVAGLEFDDMEM